MAANPAGPHDIVNRWRPLTDDEHNVASSLLGDAWALLKHHAPTVETRLDADPVGIDANLVIMILVAMVKRVMANPNGFRQETIQDYSYTRDSTVAAGALYLTADELDLLADADTSTGGAFTIRPAYQVVLGAQTFDSTTVEWRP